MLLRAGAAIATLRRVAQCPSDAARRRVSRPRSPASRPTNFPDKSAAVTAITELHASRTAAPCSSSLLDGKLYFRNADNKVFITDGGEATLALTDPLTLKAAGSGAAGRLHAHHHQQQPAQDACAARWRASRLSDPDADVRLAAVHEMLRSIDEDSVALLRARLEKESDAAVKKAMREGLALADLDSSGGGDAARRREGTREIAEPRRLQPARRPW